MSATSSSPSNQINDHIKKLETKIQKYNEDIKIKKHACSRLQDMLEVDYWEMSCVLIKYQSLPTAHPEKKELEKEIDNLYKSFKIGKKILEQIIDEYNELEMQKTRLKIELSCFL